MRNVSRRCFLKNIGATAAVAVARPGAIAESIPGQGSSRPRLLPGCCALSYSKQLSQGAMTMEDFIVKGVELGVNAVDLTAYWLTSTEPAYLAHLRHLAFKNGLAFSGTAIRTQMCLRDAGERKQQVEEIKKWIDATQLLGASHLRVFGGDLPPGASEQQGIAWVADTMKAACDYSGKYAITLGIEDHHGITARAEQVLEIVRRVDSPFAGINVDIENFEVKTEEQRYSEIEACMPYATHIHVRDVNQATGRAIDLERAWRIFARAGFKGYISAEYEGEEDPLSGVPKLVEQIKGLCHRYSSI